jgi:hypothetical protein
MPKPKQYMSRKEWCLADLNHAYHILHTLGDMLGSIAMTAAADRLSDTRLLMNDLVKEEKHDVEQVLES